MSNVKAKKSWIESIIKHPVTALVIIFLIYLFSTLILSMAFPWLSKVILPNTSLGIYNKDFWVNLLVNLNASLIDFIFFGIALFLLQRRSERNTVITDMINELNDISKYNDQVVNLRKIGLFRRLAELNHFNYTMHRLVISGASIEVRDIDFKESDFTGMEGDDIYVNGLQVSNSNLSSSTFSRSRMKNVKFRFCNLKNIKLVEAKMRGVTFENCNFTGANLKDSNLQSSMMKECTFENVNFEGANMDRANLKGAKKLNIDELCKAKSLNYLAIEDHLKLEIKARVSSVKFSR